MSYSHFAQTVVLFSAVFRLTPMLKDYVRISIGSEDDLKVLINIFAEWEHAK